MDTKQTTKLIVGVGRGRNEPPELTTNQKKTPIVKDSNTGEVLAKRCGKCGEMNLRKDMVTCADKGDGMTSWCLNCKKAYNAIPENKKREAEYHAEYYANPENKKRKAEYDAEYYAIPENKKRKAEYDAERQRNNPEKVAKKQAKRKAMKRNLPNESIENLSFDTCVLTGDTSNVHIEHMIPLRWGHGGTYPGNCYALEGSANKSKGSRNPFEWFADYGERYGITIEAWSDLIEDMANRNRMDTSEYVRFVNWCYSNQRTLEQIKADNMRYGYIVDSLTLYREAMRNGVAK